MPNAYADIAFTPSIRALQEQDGSRASYARFEETPTMRNATLTARETTFLAARDSFYMASISETGWPYVQHRGGPRGFVQVLSRTQIGFADFAGNRQFVSLGNFAHDDRVSLIFVDYPNRRRLKLYGHAKALSGDEAARLAVPGYDADVQRGFAIEVAAFDWNCPQHITPRWSAEELSAIVGPQ